MNTSELYLLGKHLMDLARDAMGDVADPETHKIDELLVDVMLTAGHGVSIGELTARSGFAQSHVSVAVARMRDAGWLIVERDPADKRRTLVRPVTGLIEETERRAVRDAGQVIAAALRETDADSERLTAAVEELYQLLVARALNPNGKDTT